MKIDLSEYKIDYCKHCNQENCVRCITTEEWLATPTYFMCNDSITLKYVKLLDDFSKILHNIGFEIK